MDGLVTLVAAFGATLCRLDTVFFVRAPFKPDQLGTCVCIQPSRGAVVIDVTWCERKHTHVFRIVYLYGWQGTGTWEARQVLATLGTRNARR